MPSKKSKKKVRQEPSIIQSKNQEETVTLDAREIEELAKTLEKTSGIEFPRVIKCEAAEFLISLLDLPDSPSVLFPRDETGVVAQIIRQIHPGARFTFYTDEPSIQSHLESLCPEYQVFRSETLLDLAEKETKRFDLILGVLHKPRRLMIRNAAGSPSNQTKPAGCAGYEENRMRKALSKLLARDGKLVSDCDHFLESSYLADRRTTDSVYTLNSYRKENAGLAISAVIEDILVDGSRSETFIIAVNGEQGKVFSASYSDVPETLDATATNYRTKSNGSRVESGYWSSIEAFRPNVDLRRQETARELARKAGLKEFRLGELIGKLQQSESEEPKNVLYVKAHSYTHHLGESGPILGLQPPADHSWFEVQLDPGKALAEYVLEFYEYSRVGRMLLDDMVLYQAPDCWVTERSIRECLVFLPPVSTQLEVIRADSKLSALSNEIGELKSQLWTKPRQVEEVTTRTDKINKEETFKNWLDLLPFPLASTLWWYRTKSRTPYEQYNNLVHVFEACAEFLSIIHISALSTDTELWEKVKAGLASQGSHLQIRTATFGTWLTLLEKMAKIARMELGQNDSRENVFKAYRTRSRTVIEQLSSKRIITALKTAVPIRNDWKGHDPAVDDEKALELHDKLNFLLQEVRSVITGIWDHYQLVTPESSRFVKDQFEYKVQLIMGPLTPFDRTDFSTSHPLEDGFLYLLETENRQAIKVLPLIRVAPGPRTKIDACYFYNRVEEGTGTARFVSYHFGQESELMSTIEDGVEDALKLFGPL